MRASSPAWTAVSTSRSSATWNRGMSPEKTYALPSARSGRPSASVPSRWASSTERSPSSMAASISPRTKRPYATMPQAAAANGWPSAALSASAALGPADQLVAKPSERVLPRRNDDTQRRVEVADIQRVPYGEAKVVEQVVQRVEPRTLVGAVHADGTPLADLEDPRPVPAGDLRSLTLVERCTELAERLEQPVRGARTRRTPAPSTCRRAQPAPTRPCSAGPAP